MTTAPTAQVVGSTLSNGVKLLGGTIEYRPTVKTVVYTLQQGRHPCRTLVTGNNAEPGIGKLAKGGGIWLCPTGDLTMRHR